MAVPVEQYNQPGVQSIPYQQPNPIQPYPQLIPNQAVYQQGPQQQNNIDAQPNPIQPQASLVYNSTDFTG